MKLQYSDTNNYWHKIVKDHYILFVTGLKLMKTSQTAHDEPCILTILIRRRIPSDSRTPGSAANII